MTQENTKKTTPIKTEVGFISGRDAIYLRDVDFISDSEYCIKGQLSGYNCSLVNEDIALPFSLMFKGVLLWRAVELDFAERLTNIETDSCFDLIEYSEILKNFRSWDAAASTGKIDRGYDKSGKFSDEIWHRHFVLSTYDTVFEIVAQSYDLVIGEPENPNYVSVENALKSQQKQ